MNRGDYQAKHKRPSHDWFIEPERAVEQILDTIDFGDDLIWDCCCGRGTVLDVAERWGHPTFGSDIVDRKPRHRFQRGNILTQIAKMPTRLGRATSVISNIPFSYESEIGERIICHVLESYPVRIAAFIVPISFLAGQNRWSRMIFNRRKPLRPSHTLIYTERHSMPPGDKYQAGLIDAKGGTMDYAVLVFKPPHRWRTETIFVPPGPRFPNRQTKGEANAA